MPPYKIVGYYAGWTVYGDESLPVTAIPADKLTHINYAFANISPEGECILGDEHADTLLRYPEDVDGQALYGNFNQLNLLKEKHPHLQTLISVGGWTWSDYFSDVALTEASRTKFARSCVDFILKYGFDGVDIDWEYPAGGGEAGNIERPEDVDNFILLMAALRESLDEQGAIDGRDYLLTVAVGASKRQVESVDWAQAQQYLDWINVMTYDFSGAWSVVTSFNAPLYRSVERPPEGGSSADSLQAYLAAGVLPEKLIQGVPFYGRGWKGVSAENDGLHQPYAGLPNESGSFDYHVLVTNYVNQNGYVRYWSDAAAVPWLYNEQTGIMITYDDPESIALKAAYVVENQLAGVMFWELSGDTRDSALLTAIYETLK